MKISVDIPTYTCFDIDYNETYVCSGNGVCIGPDECVCDDSERYYGVQCELTVCGQNFLSNIIPGDIIEFDILKVVYSPHHTFFLLVSMINRTNNYNFTVNNLTYLLKIDTGGNVVKSESFTFSFQILDIAVSSFDDADAFEYIITGFIGNNETSIPVLKITSSGEIIWAKKIETNGKYEIVGEKLLIQNSNMEDGSIVVMGYHVTSSEVRNNFVVCLESNGDERWKKNVHVGNDETEWIHVTAAVLVESSTDILFVLYREGRLDAIEPNTGSLLYSKNIGIEGNSLTVYVEPQFREFLLISGVENVLFYIFSIWSGEIYNSWIWDNETLSYGEKYSVNSIEITQYGNDLAVTGYYTERCNTDPGRSRPNPSLCYEFGVDYFPNGFFAIFNATAWMEQSIEYTELELDLYAEFGTDSTEDTGVQILQETFSPPLDDFFSVLGKVKIINGASMISFARVNISSNYVQGLPINCGFHDPFFREEKPRAKQNLDFPETTNNVGVVFSDVGTLVISDWVYSVDNETHFPSFLLARDLLWEENFEKVEMCQYYCDGVYLEDMDVCSGEKRGLCNYIETEEGSGINSSSCSCQSNYYGDDCSIYDCNSYPYYDERACQGHGDCQEFGDLGLAFQCFCESGYFANGIEPSAPPVEACNSWKCFGDVERMDFPENPLSCSGHGNCTSPDFCECRNGYFGGGCDSYTCNGFLRNDTQNVCSGNGTCVSPDVCECYDGYGENGWCNTYKCFGEDLESNSICSEHGQCVNSNECVCEEHYFAADCYILMKDFKFQVREPEEEEKEDEYENLFTEFSIVYYVLTSDVDPIFLERFNCSLIVDLESYHSYFSFNSSFCYFEIVSIFGFKVTSTLRLVAYSNLEEEMIDTNLLIGEIHMKIIPITSPEYSDMVDFSVVIDEDKPGDNEEDDEQGASENYLWAAITFPSFVGVVILFFSVLCCCCVLGICFVLFLVGLFLILALGSALSMSSQYKRLSKFQKLDDFELILKEQLLEKDQNLAKIKINKKLISIDFSNLKLLSVLGEGGSGSTVYKCSWNGMIIAFKSFKTRVLMSTQHDFDQFETEANLLASVAHPNIITFYGACLKPPRIGFAMEFCENGDIGAYMKKIVNSEKYIPYDEKMRFLVEISSAMAYLHDHRVIHRDLKLENVLLDGKMSCKVMDFGVSRMIEKTTQIKTKKIGTCVYMSPEVTTSVKYNEKVDVFSFGIMLHVLYYEDEHPYGEKETMMVELKVAQDSQFRPDTEKVGPCGEKPSPFLVDLMKQCWAHDHEDRLSFQSINEKLSTRRLELMQKSLKKTGEK